MNYRQKYVSLIRRRHSLEMFDFVLYGIFAGLLLSGVVGKVPVQALGIGCAIVATSSLWNVIYWGWMKVKHDRMPEHDEEDLN